ncbi:TPA: ArsR family transcriptional regulator [Candidatus Bathyarchaeota archaeon]|nr:ArsR family transcriptional regulator [Candidatus Bathyarchaeota archaeon]
MARHTGLKLQLVRDGHVILEVPISITEWSKENLENEMKSIEEEIQRFSKIFDALSNETRIRMMRRFLIEEDASVRFADLMQDLDLNPKIVWENLGKLNRCGFLEKTGRGKYRCSEFGQRAFMLMSLAMRHLLEIMEEIEEI